MEHVLKAAVAGVVVKVGVAAGELVEDSRVCLVLGPGATEVKK